MRALAAAGAALGGWVVTWFALRHPPPALRRPPHLRDNYHGRPVAGTLGVLLVAAIVAGILVALADGWRTGRGVRTQLLAAGAGTAMAAFGLLDDVYARRRAGGFAGHLRALARGEVTTGMLKALGGTATGLAVAWGIGLRGRWLVAGGAVVALSANLVNLLDLRPGRAGKVWLVAWAALLPAMWTTGTHVVPAAVAGGLVAFLPADLSERVMLGDTGANLLGAVWGTAAVASVGPGAMLVVLAVLAALTLASEVVSFTQVIDRFGPLRAVDRLGRPPD